MAQGLYLILRDLRHFCPQELNRVQFCVLLMFIKASLLQVSLLCESQFGLDRCPKKFSLVLGVDRPVNYASRVRGNLSFSLISHFRKLAEY